MILERKSKQKKLKPKQENKIIKYFYDTEFIERGRDYPIDLISIGMVAEDGRELYLQNTKCQFSAANDWVWENVIKKLEDSRMNGRQLIQLTNKEAHCWRSPEGIADELRFFVGDDENVEFWAYYADYDHVVLSQLFGTMMNLPKNFPMFTMDIKQRCMMLGNPKLPKQEAGEHNALDDARWNRDMYNFLDQYEIPKLLGGGDLTQIEKLKLMEKLKENRNASALLIPNDGAIERLDAVSKITLPKPKE